jgi:ATP-dependent Zn protease
MSEALAATSDSEVERILPELRSALQEHIRLAKESLEAQVVTLEGPLSEMT